VREYTEGIMELGARVCTPKLFQCEKCPLKWGCVAKKKNIVGELPRKMKSRKREKHIEVVYLLKRKNKIALSAKGADPKYPDFRRLPFEARKAPKKYLGKHKYSVTHRDFTVYVSDQAPKLKGLQWRSKASITKDLLPAIDRKIINAYIS